MLFSVFLLAVLLVSLIGARNVIAAHLQGITLLLTGKKRLGLIIYSLLFLPGVIIHEISHFFVAAFLGVRTGDITIFPSESDSGRKSLGSVQIAKADIFRSSLIGIAPLFLGSLIIFATIRFQFPQLLDSLTQFNDTLSQFLIEGKIILAEPLNFVWLYLIFAISNTMFVSQEDRRSWPALIIILLLLSFLAIWTGVATPIALAVREPLSQAVTILTAAFFISLVIDVLVLAILFTLQKLLEKISRKRLVVN